MEIITQKYVTLTENEIIHLRRAASILGELDDATCGETDWEINEIIDAILEIVRVRSWHVEI